MNKITASLTVLLLGAGMAQAALWNSAWSGATYTTISDPSGDAAGGIAVRDITQLEAIYGADGSGTGYYFRMTLAGSGTKNNAYMLNFNTDALPTGANAGNSTYIASGITGIDRIVDVHYAGGFEGNKHNHTFNGSLGNNILFDEQSLASSGGVYQEVTSTQLEWFVPTALVGSTATVRGSSLYVGTTFGGGDPTVTYDITDLTLNVIPEPTSMALLALGVAALGLRRKLRA